MKNKPSNQRKDCELFENFWQLQGYFLRKIHENISEYDLSITQYITLRTLYAHSSMTQKKIQQETLLPKSTLSHAVNKLVELELIDRYIMEEDRREIILTILDKGKKMISKLHQEEKGIDQVLYQATRTLSDEEVKMFQRILQQIIKHLKN